MSTLQVGILFGIATFVALFSGMPIAFAVGGVALVFMLIYMPVETVGLVAETLYSELDNFVLLTIPLFVLMGAAIGKSRAGADLYSSLNRWMGRIPGGLRQVARSGEKFRVEGLRGEGEERQAAVRHGALGQVGP